MITIACLNNRNTKKRKKEVIRRGEEGKKIGIIYET